jgi:hypothetical protein
MKRSKRSASKDIAPESGKRRNRRGAEGVES